MEHDSTFGVVLDQPVVDLPDAAFDNAAHLRRARELRLKHFMPEDGEAYSTLSEVNARPDSHTSSGPEPLSVGLEHFDASASTSSEDSGARDPPSEHYGTSESASSRKGKAREGSHDAPMSGDALLGDFPSAPVSSFDNAARGSDDHVANEDDQTRTYTISTTNVSQLVPARAAAASNADPQSLVSSPSTFLSQDHSESSARQSPSAESDVPLGHLRQEEERPPDLGPIARPIPPPVDAGANVEGNGGLGFGRDLNVDVWEDIDEDEAQDAIALDEDLDGIMEGASTSVRPAALVRLH